MSTKIIILLIILILVFYSFFIEPNMLKTTRYKLNDKSLSGIKVVFVGDFHIKPSQKKRLEKIVKTINSENPDIVLSAGDYISGHNEKMTMPIKDIVHELKNIKAKYGFYTVLGNHDILFTDEIKELFKESTIYILNNSNEKIKINNKTIYIAGVEDLQTGNPDVNKAIANTDNPTLLLTHSPDIFTKVPKEVNLTLAGHVHGGQVRIPYFKAIVIPSRYGNRYSLGYIEENNRKMIVTSGIGTSILPVRFNCLPEIVVIEFI